MAMKTTTTWELFSGRDLIAKYHCSCGETHTLWGYNDAYYWDTVSAEPREIQLACGMTVFVQWFKNNRVIIDERGAKNV